ncbi:hypothetical protein Leryth_022786 [Lithospermum erythrorhizon]|nr:hypothetical protein Leryth_022786 [Lithospermum erythrorhizon]
MIWYINTCSMPIPILSNFANHFLNPPVPMGSSPMTLRLRNDLKKDLRSPSFEVVNWSSQLAAMRIFKVFLSTLDMPSTISKSFFSSGTNVEPLLSLERQVESLSLEGSGIDRVNINRIYINSQIVILSLNSRGYKGDGITMHFPLPLEEAQEMAGLRLTFHQYFLVEE